MKPLAAIVEEVDQGRDIDDGFFDQRVGNLPLLKRLGLDGDKNQPLDTEAGLNLLDAVVPLLEPLKA